MFCNLKSTWLKVNYIYTYICVYNCCVIFQMKRCNYSLIILTSNFCNKDIFLKSNMQKKKNATCKKKKKKCNMQPTLKWSAIKVEDFFHLNHIFCYSNEKNKIILRWNIRQQLYSPKHGCIDRNICIAHIKNTSF